MNNYFGRAQKMYYNKFSRNVINSLTFRETPIPETQSIPQVQVILIELNRLLCFGVYIFKLYVNMHF